MKRSNRWKKRGATVAFTAAVAVLVVLVTVPGGTATAASAVPRVTADPLTVIDEGFEHEVGETIMLLDEYVGAPPLSPTYTADPAWLTSCNGYVISAEQPAEPPAGVCPNPWWNGMQELARSLGIWAGVDPETNHALAAYTAGLHPGAGKVQLATVSAIPLTTASRFLTFSVDAAEHCAGVRTLMRFSLVDGDTAIPATPDVVSPCADPQDVVNGAAIGTYRSAGALLFPGSSVGVRLINDQGNGIGNDFGFDNVRIADVTPQLDLAFSEALAPADASVTLTYTITNTSDLLAKPGWSFTNVLPSGLAVASPALATTDCPGGSVTPSGTSVAVSGSLVDGMASCTASVQVTSSGGTFSNCADDIVDRVGLNPPGCAVVQFNARPVVDVGGPYAGQEGGPVSIAAVVTDPDGPSVAHTWSVTPELGPGGPDGGTTCAIADPFALATTVTCTDDGRFTVTLTASDSFNPPVEASTLMTLTNVAPSVTISAPADRILVERGEPVTFTAPFTDAGRNDTHTCTFDYEHGVPVTPGTVAGGTCTGTHAFTALGAHLVTVTVTDDDGSSGTAVVTVLVYLPAEAYAVRAAGLVNIPKTPHATCPPSESLTQIGLPTPLGTIDTLSASCIVDEDTGRTVAHAAVNGATLLGGLIALRNIESTCSADAETVLRTSSVGTLNGIPIGTRPTTIGIPGVAQVFLNESTTVGGRPAQHAVRIRTLLGQEIVLAGCSI